MHLVGYFHNYNFYYDSAGGHKIRLLVPLGLVISSIFFSLIWTYWAYQQSFGFYSNMGLIKRRRRNTHKMAPTVKIMFCNGE